jgi:hypothetical protein
LREKCARNQYLDPLLLITIKNKYMAILKVIEILANSNKSWEDAANNAVKHAAKSVKNIRSVYINEQSASVDGDSITEYRINAKITFEVK